MNRKRYFKTAVLMGLLLSQLDAETISAQDSTKFLSLNEAISNSLQNNQTIQIAVQDEKIAQSRYKQIEAIYLPQLSFNYTAMGTNNPLNAFGLKLQQQSITMNDFNPEILNHPQGTPDFTTRLELMQPIINLDRWMEKKAAAKQTEIYQFQTTRTKEYIRFEVQKAYLQLTFYYDVMKVLEDTKKTTLAVNKFASDHFNQGLIQKSDVLNTEVQIKIVESNLAKAHTNIQNASDYLSLLMHQPIGIIYRVDTSKSAPSTPNQSIIQLKDSRADFMAMQSAIDASACAISASRKSYLPRINAFGSYQFNDSRIMGFGANAYLAGIQLSWKIFNGNQTKNTISTQTLERNKLKEQLTQQKDQGQLELNKTLRELNDANFEIIQQEKALEQASESLRILQNRYEQGLVNTTDVLLASTQLSQIHLSKAQAILNSNITQAYIQFLTSGITH